MDLVVCRLWNGPTASTGVPHGQVSLTSYLLEMIYFTKRRLDLFNLFFHLWTSFSSILNIHINEGNKSFIARQLNDFSLVFVVFKKKISRFLWITYLDRTMAVNIVEKCPVMFFCFCLDFR